MAIKRIVSKQGHAVFSNMFIEVHNCSPASYFEEMKAKETAVAFVPILNAALVAENRQTFATSVAVKMFLDKHDLEREGATNLCTNIFKNKGDLEKIKEEAISVELNIHWNGPPINMCSSVVRQTLNWDFNGKPWHVNATDICAKFHSVCSGG